MASENQLVENYLDDWANGASALRLAPDMSSSHRAITRRQLLNTLAEQSLEQAKSLPPSVGSAAICSRPRCHIVTISHCDNCQLAFCVGHLRRQPLVLQSGGYVWMCTQCAAGQK